MAEEGLTDGRYRELRGMLTGIIETLDGKGREPGVKQELRELKHLVEGRPPNYDDGVRYAIRDVRDNHATLRSDFDTYVDTQNTEAANRSGRWKGAYTVYAVILGFVTLVAGGVGLLVSVRQAITQAIGGG